MTIKTDNILTPPTGIGALLDEFQQASAFMAAAAPIEIRGNGSFMHFVGNAVASFVSEGQNKPVSDPETSSLEINPQKISVIVPVSTELAADEPALLAKIHEVLTGALPRAVDEAVSGVTTAPAGFGTLKAAATVTVTDYASFIKATRGSNRSKQIVLNNMLLAELLSVTNAHGVPALQISETAKTINGIPYFVSDSIGSDAVGFVGPFATDTYAGVVPGSFEVSVTREGTAVDGTGQVLHAFGQNLALLRAEVRVGYGINPARLTEFSKLKVTAPAPAGK